MSEEADLAGRRVLVIDDDTHVRRTLRLFLKGSGYEVEEGDSAQALFERLSGGAVDLIIMDVRMPGLSGLDALDQLRADDRSTPVIMVSGDATLDEAARAMKAGASDFLQKPLSEERVRVSVANAIQRDRLARRVRALEAAQPEPPGGMLGQSEGFRQIQDQIAKVAPKSVRVLITGESGTGKELIARAIHEASARRDGPFVKVNCAAIPDELIESELFGHEKGAFSGAVQKRRGHFELADGGTLFLDEIGDMSLSAQAKVLRALQTGEIVRVGGERPFVVDVRVLAATNRDLEHEVAEGSFREDLYFRLAVVPIHSPPLREREGDIMLLMQHYLARFSREHSVEPPVTLSPEAETLIRSHPFPGNVRELRNLAERLVILAGNPVRAEDLPAPVRKAAPSPAGSPPGLLPADETQDMTLRAFKAFAEREFVRAQLERHDWNITQTAAQLGMERTNLHKKLRQLDLHKPEA